MKKLMMLLGVVAVAGITQAATVTWGTDAIMVPNADGSFSTDTKTAKGSVQGYLWEVNAATFATYAADTSLIIAEYQKGGFGALGTETTTAASGTSRKVSLIGTTNWAEGDTAYGLVIYDYNDGTAHHYIANAAKYENMGTADASVDQLNVFKGGSIGGVAQGAAITGYAQAAPEPTSAMLLLLGMAGLALKRKRT